MSKSLRAELAEMHTYRRPYQSPVEHLFRDVYVRPLGAVDDASGNLHVIIGDARTLFSCHTDTVHMSGGRQTLHVNYTDQTLALSKRASRYSNCLGADDTVGVFLMRQMVLAGVPGRYVFHSGEERGCIGSQAYAKEAPDVLRQYDHAIAFDRKGLDSVITHQMGQRSASQAFAAMLSNALSHNGLAYAPDDSGLYTDTESYADLIPECTNLSVGYQGAHGGGETVHMDHVLRLLDVALTLDWASLPVVRDPFADRKSAWGSWGSGFKYLDAADIIEDDDVCSAGLADWYCPFGCQEDTRVTETRASCYLREEDRDIQTLLRRPTYELTERGYKLPIGWRLAKGGK